MLIEKDAISAGSKYDLLPYPTTSYSTTIKAPPKNKNKKKQCFLPFPHWFYAQSSQHQN